ncbi:hypothetical protein G7054_g14735 [Neopestalotiopsis clavispora]|nr:hypothetical protein G7054_g14735 [Neopestalotiopsis clavispora]
MLEYDPNPNVHHITVNKTRVKNPYWSKQFCEGLENLLVHPLWAGDFASMVIFIQYAVMCRTNDQRGSQWPRENPTSDLLFETFRQYTANIHHDMESVVDLHQRALRGLGNVPSKTSKLLLAIEAAAFDAVTEPFLPSEPTAPYKVRTKDLQAVSIALENLKVNGTPVYLPPKTYLSMISDAIREPRTAPLDTKLEECRERVLLDMQRNEIRNNNLLRINRNIQDPANEPLMPGAVATGPISGPQPTLGLEQSNPPPFGERPVIDIPNLPEFASDRGFQDPDRKFKLQSLKFRRLAPSMLLHDAVYETAETHVLLDPNHSGLEVPKI